MKLLVIGRNEILFATARYLIQNTSHRIVLIMTGPARPEYKKKEDDFKRLSAECEAGFWFTRGIDDQARRIAKDSGAEIGISINWVSVLDQSFISLLPNGILNAHFGDLPRYRGNAVTNWALLMDEKEIALTIHRMQGGEIDSGDILCKKRLALTHETTINDINMFAETNIPPMFAEVIGRIESGTLEATPQQETGLQPFRCYPRLPRDGRIRWDQPARKIQALVRSLAKPYSGAFVYYRPNEEGLEKLFVWETRVVCDHTQDLGVPGHVIMNDPRSGESWVFTGRGILALRTVSHGEDGPVFKPGKVWKSIRMRLEMDLEEELFHALKRPRTR